MNTIQKYAVAYIFECLTGIQGENPERIREVLKATSAKMGDPLLQEIATLAKAANLDSQSTKEYVCDLALNRITTENPYVANSLAEIARECTEETKQREPKITLSYSDRKGDTTFVIWKDLEPLNILILSSEYKQVVIDKFQKHYPEGMVVDANNN